MGNEAIARGAIEADVRLVVGYPGTPSSEVIQTLLTMTERSGMRVEWAVNEKVAVDIGAGAAMAGSRALVTMKSAGLNVASDSIVSIAYGGVDGGLVIYVADDPAAHAGMEEQDSRFYTGISLLPMIDVFDPQDAKDAVVEAFDLSEEFKIPVFLRSTTQVAHMRADVMLGSIKRVQRRPELQHDIKRYTRASPAWCMEQHALVNSKVEKMKSRLESSRLNELSIPQNCRGVGIVASGVSWNYLREVMNSYRVRNVAVLRLGMVNPLPEGVLRRLITQVDRILVLEELEPFIELRVKAMIADIGKPIRLYGKCDNTLPRVGEYNYNVVEEAMSKLLRFEIAKESFDIEKEKEQGRRLAPGRSLPFCPGCPHSATYAAMRQAFRQLGYGQEDVIVTGDIGCTILGMNPPFNMCWTEVSMGASIGQAIGLRYAGIEKPIIAAIGDSTFFHAGIPPTINTSWYKTDIVIAVLDNQITAMTGHQPSPSSGYTGSGEKAPLIKIEKILEAAGIEKVTVVDPYDLQKTKEAFVEALKRKGPLAIILRRMCALVARRMGLREKPSNVEVKKCTGCQQCIRTLSCPSMSLLSDGKIIIDSGTCVGCGVCVQICPSGAIMGGDRG